MGHSAYIYPAVREVHSGIPILKIFLTPGCLNGDDIPLNRQMTSVTDTLSTTLADAPQILIEILSATPINRGAILHYLPFLNNVTQTQMDILVDI